jgi:hypothetical protein
MNANQKKLRDAMAASPQKWDGCGEPSLPGDSRQALSRRGRETQMKE